jgi:cold-inducible RNA-binding protein
MHFDDNQERRIEMNIYVGNLPYNATEDEVREVFAAFGQVKSVALIKDKFTGQPRGFGFVEMTNDAEAQKAIQALNGKDFKSRSLVVNPARPREERGGSRQGGGGGGYSDSRRSSGGNRERRGQQGGDRRKEDW